MSLFGISLFGMSLFGMALFGMSVVGMSVVGMSIIEGSERSEDVASDTSAIHSAILSAIISSLLLGDITASGVSAVDCVSLSLVGALSDVDVEGVVSVGSSAYSSGISSIKPVDSDSGTSSCFISCNMIVCSTIINIIYLKNVIKTSRNRSRDAVS